MGVKIGLDIEPERWKLSFITIYHDFTFRSNNIIYYNSEDLLNIKLEVLKSFNWMYNDVSMHNRKNSGRDCSVNTTKDNTTIIMYGLFYNIKEKNMVAHDCTDTQRSLFSTFFHVVHPCIHITSQWLVHLYFSPLAQVFINPCCLCVCVCVCLFSGCYLSSC